MFSPPFFTRISFSFRVNERRNLLLPFLRLDYPKAKLKPSSSFFCGFEFRTGGKGLCVRSPHMAAIYMLGKCSSQVRRRKGRGKEIWKELSSSEGASEKRKVLRPAISRLFCAKREIFRILLLRSTNFPRIPNIGFPTIRLRNRRINFQNEKINIWEIVSTHIRRRSRLPPGRLWRSWPGWRRWTSDARCNRPWMKDKKNILYGKSRVICQKLYRAIACFTGNDRMGSWDVLQRQRHETPSSFCSSSFLGPPIFPLFPHFHNALTTVATLGYPECGFLGGYPEFFLAKGEMGVGRRRRIFHVPFFFFFFRSWHPRSQANYPTQGKVESAIPHKTKKEKQQVGTAAPLILNGFFPYEPGLPYPEWWVCAWGGGGAGEQGLLSLTAHVLKIKGKNNPIIQME